MTRRFLAGVLGVQVTLAWNDCEFPAVDYFAIDEGVGVSYTYALAAMNGNMYSGGYTKGNFAFVGVKKEGVDDVSPVACQTLWGQTTSDLQNLYVAEVSSSGQMTKGWHFKGTAIQEGEIGHGPQTNSIAAHNGLHKMMDNAHIAVMGGFKGELLLPDGTTQWSSATRQNTKDQVPFVMKLDVSSTVGFGTGTTGWAKQMVSDSENPGGATMYSVDGDASGNMIVSFKGCTSYDPTATGYDAYGRPTTGAAVGCKMYLTKLAAADGSQVWLREVPVGVQDCRVIQDGSFFCGFTSSEMSYEFGNSVSLTGTGGKIAVVKFDTDGDAQWAKESHAGSFYDLAVNKDATLLAVAGGDGYYNPAFLARIDTSSNNEGTVLWSDNGGVGTHGFRGVEVTADPTDAIQEVVGFGQVTGSHTLTDPSGATTTLNSRGSYEVFVAAYNAADGTGKYAMDGGGTGMEYFFAFARDPSTGDVYTGGTSRSEYIQWGNVERKNPMYNGDPGENNPDTSSPVGSSKAFAVKLKSQTEMPDCLSSCSNNVPVVKSGHCYIDRYCYADQESAPYAGAGCMMCKASSSQGAWSGPEGIGTSHCYINSKCVESGEHKQVSSGRSTVDSQCEVCTPSTSGSEWSMVDGYEMANGACHETTWEEYATRAGWTQPCNPDSHVHRARRARKLSLSKSTKESLMGGMNDD
jgi:hypothetical protein